MHGDSQNGHREGRRQLVQIQTQQYSLITRVLLSGPFNSGDIISLSIDKAPFMRF